MRKAGARESEDMPEAPRSGFLLLTPRSAATALGVIVFLLLYGTLPGTGPWSRNILSGVKILYTNRKSDEETRGRSLMGDAYALVRHAERMTPPTSRILIPGGPDYDPVSNRVWCAYYLHPRRILQQKDLAGPLEESVDYVLVYHGWYLKEAGLPPDPRMNAVLDVAVLGKAARSKDRSP